MLRYVIDNPSKFKYLDVPPWKIEKGIDFASIYKIINHTLMKAPTKYGQLPGYTKRNGVKFKTPGSYTWSNSENGKGFLKSRIEILLRVLTAERGVENIKCQKVFEEMRDGGAIIEIDDTPMPSIEQVWMSNPQDADGNIVPISQLDSSIYDRGHKIAKSKGGSNTDVVLQKKRDNRQWQEDYEHNQQ